MKNIQGLKFKLALQFHLDGDQVGYKVHGGEWPKGPGVYAVYENNTLVYIGKYQRGVMYRWVKQKKRGLYHFKKDQVAASLKDGKTVQVFAEQEDALKQTINSSTSQWINVSGIEAHLVEACGLDLPWNKNGKKKPSDVYRTLR
jgi:hypothetical protein